MKPKILSLFSGCGGLDLGFKKSGFDIVFSTDIWEKACDSLKKNFKKTDVIKADIDDIKFKDLNKKYSKIDGIIGGPPCPPFSKSRFYRKEKKRGIDDREGYKTFYNYLRAIKEINPTFFLFENVFGFVYAPHKDALEVLNSESEKHGYKLTYKVLNSANYGVPQIRERFFCVGVKKDLASFDFPQQTHANKEKEPSKQSLLFDSSNGKLKPWVTCGDVLNDIDYSLPEDNFDVAGSKHNHLLKQVPPGDNYLFFTEKRNHPNPEFKWRSRYWSFLLKLSPEKPSWTIQASHSNNMGPFHWRNRFLRINEIKRIQSFPDDFILAGDYKEQWRQIGNAVPPLFAEIFAKELKKQYF